MRKPSKQKKERAKKSVTGSASTAQGPALNITTSEPGAPIMKAETGVEVQKVYDEFWKGIIERDGIVDLDQVKKELSDYSFLLKNVPKVYAHITGGKLSKPNYPADVIIAEFDDAVNKAVADETEELRNQLAEAETEEDPGAPLSDAEKRERFIRDYVRICRKYELCIVEDAAANQPRAMRPEDGGFYFFATTISGMVKEHVDGLLASEGVTE